jgi:hypothetical protein
MRRAGRAVVVLAVLYATWLGMLATHELGHCLHAWASDGRVARVSIPVLGFSQTIVWPNPHERLVVWGGPVWGALLPVIACGIVRTARWRVPEAMKFFAGFCLIANGAYIGIGWIWHSGDAGDLLRLGTPRGAMIAFGVAYVAAGLGVWHRTSWLTRRAGAAEVNREKSA